MNKKAFLGISLMLIILSISLLGCGDAGGRSKNRAPSYVVITKISPSMVSSDVTTASDEMITVSMAARPLNFNPDIDPNSNADMRFMDVMIQGYTVNFYRTDTGEAAPATFTDHIDAYLEVQDSLNEVDVGIRVLRGEQKTMTPLSFLNDNTSFGYEPATGLESINCTAHITFFGRTVSGHSLTWETQIPITFF